MNKIWLLVLFSVFGCAVESTTIDINQASFRDQAVQIDESRAGDSPIGDCSPAPLAIDPRWADLAPVVREGVRMWSDAVGVDLGPLPLAESCDRGERELNCIAMRDVAIESETELVAGINLYLGTMQAKGLGIDYLRRAVAHEVGHWIGLPEHTDSGVMATNDRDGASELSDADIAAYEAVCVQ